MKVVYVLNVFPKLSETFILNEIVQAQKQGIDVEVVAFSEGCEDRIHPDVLKVGTVRYFRTASKWSLVNDHAYWLLHHPLRYFKTLCIAANRSNGISRKFIFNLHNMRLIERMKPDHIHAHFGTWTADLAMMAGLLTGVPYTFTTHSYDIFSFPPANLALKSRLAKKHITISIFNKDFLIRKYDIRPDDVAVVHCGVDFSKVQGRASPASNKIVTIARLEKSKGIDHLIRIYGLLKSRGCDFEAVIVGDGDQRLALESLVVELGLQDRVRLVGNRTQNDIFEILPTCKLMVMTSKVEGIPVSLMEAMAFHIPVIASRITGVPELVEDGVCGYLVAPDETEGLVDKIERLLNDEALRAEFTRNGFEKVKREFDLSVEVAKLVEIWEGRGKT